MIDSNVKLNFILQQYVAVAVASGLGTHLLPGLSPSLLMSSLLGSPSKPSPFFPSPQCYFPFLMFPYVASCFLKFPHVSYCFFMFPHVSIFLYVSLLPHVSKFPPVPLFFI